MLIGQNASVKESKMAYYVSGNRSSKAIAALLPLVSDLEERIEELKKRQLRSTRANETNEKINGCIEEKLGVF
jgi:hypothetical protein